MPQCAFRNCRNNYRKSKLADGVSYFRFPNNPFRSAEWVSIVANERAEEFYKPTKNSVICSEHFDINDIIGNTERRRLNRTAVPKYKIQPVAPEDLKTSKKQSLESNSKFHSSTIDEMDSPEQEGSDELQDDLVAPSSPSTSCEHVYEPESVKIEHLQKTLAACRKTIQEKTTEISNLQRINVKLQDKNKTLRASIDFLLNHFQGNFMGNHFLDDFN